MTEQNQTPASTPNSPPNGAADNAGVGVPTSVDFGELTDFHEGGGEYGPGSEPPTPPVEPPATPPSSGASETPPAEPPVPQTQPQVAPPVQAPAAPPTGQAPVQASPPTPPEPPAPQPQVAPGTPPATEGARAPQAPQELSPEQHREKYLPTLESQYQLSEAEVEEFRAAPEKALPKLAARLHYEVAMALRGGMEHMLPQMVSQALARTATETANEQKFFQAWPKLKELADSNPQAVEVIRNSVIAFRQVNPRASLEDVIKQAGLVACYTLQVPPDAPAVPAAPPAPQVPAQPMVAQAPPRPPGIGGVGHVQAAPVGQPAPGGDGVNWGEIAEMHESGNY